MLDKKRIFLITAAVLAAVAVVVTLIVCLLPDKDLPAGNDMSAASTVTTTTAATTATGSTTAAPADGGDDPELLDKTKQTGTAVKAEEIPAKDKRSNGIDVSKWQGKIDWQQVKRSGVEFAFIRIGYRGENGVIQKDENADYNLQQAEKAGILTGVYFFSTAVSEKEAIEEANFTLKAIEGYSVSYPVVYDCEGYISSSSRMYALTAEKRTANAVAFLKTVGSAGYDPMFYGALNEITNPAYWELSKISGQYKIWVAQYPAVTYPQKDMPDLTGKFDAWQYTNKGAVAGINGDTDMVVCYFKKSKVAPKNTAAKPTAATAPLTEEEKQYTAVNEKVTAKDITNLRAAASTDSEIIATLKNGETINRIGVGSNGWSKLTYNGKTVYAVSSYLTTDLTIKTTATRDIVENNLFTSKKDSVTAKEEVNLRALPTTDSEIVGVLKSGTFLDRVAASDKGWSRLLYNGKTVYAVTGYLTNEVIATQTQTTDDGFTAVDEQVTAKFETNLRTAPSTDSAEVVYTLKNGEYITRVGMHTNGWSKLIYNGQTVYAISSFLTTE